MTGIQAGLGVAETTITTLGAATEASIAALQAVAITAIEAAGAANSVGSNGSNLASSIPLLGSLFSSGGAAADTGAQAVGGGLLALGYHRGGIIGHSPTFTRSVSLASSQNLPRFHSGGQMSHGGVKGTDLKPGERMIIAEDGEFVINKKTAMTIGADKLQKLNRAEATVTPRFHFGGMIREFSTGGLIDSNDIGSIPQWSSGRTDAPSSTTFQAGTIPQASLMLPGGSRGINNGPSANVAIFNNPQFQNRQSVGQASAQLAAAMESGKRNR
jgi:hypothetical protein